jgi:aminopeptidase Y
VPEDYAGVDATEKIVLVKRGICTFGSKVALAKAQGAAAALIWNNVPGTVSGGTLGKGDFVAAGMISLKEGIKLVQRLEEGEIVEAEFLVDAIGEQRKTWNLIAETKDGDPENVIVVGLVLTTYTLFFAPADGADSLVRIWIRCRRAPGSMMMAPAAQRC